MHPLPAITRFLRTATLAALPWFALAPAAQAGPLVFAPFAGSGNAVLFDASTGEGGWVGSVVQTPDPGVAAPLDFVSVVSFQFDALTRMLSGQFEFTRSTDLGATLFGQVTGSTTDADLFNLGGQLALDYTIRGGTGDFAGANGFGLSFLNYDPAGTLDNYLEDGLLVFAVPEPGSLPLLAGALGLLVVLQRRRGAPQRLQR